MKSIYMYGIVSDSNTNKEYSVMKHYIIDDREDISFYYQEIYAKLLQIIRRRNLNNTNMSVERVTRDRFIEYYSV